MKIELTWPGLKPNPAPNVLASLQQNQKGEMKSTTKHNFGRSSNFGPSYFKKERISKQKKAKRNAKEDPQ